MIAALKINDNCIRVYRAKELEGAFSIRDLTNNVDALHAK
jgi:hypothetical protein